VQRAYKTELDLNNVQITACRKHAGAARWAYNWGLARKQEIHRTTGVNPSAIELHRELNALKQTVVPWMYEVSKCAPQEALRNLDTAFAHFFRRAKLKQHGQWHSRMGYPQRKTRKKGLGSFRLTGSISVFPDAIQLPRLGRLRLKERGYLPTGAAVANARVLSATVSEQAGHWYVSLLVEVEQEQHVLAKDGSVVGVDLGVKTLATFSDGTVIPNPRPLRRRLRKLKRLQQSMSRKQKGSQNRKKAVSRLARLHRRIAQQRANTLHQVTSRLAKTKSVVVVEDLNVTGMLKNHHLAQAISDVGFAEFRRQLIYKAGWYGSRVVAVSCWEPSSKMCSECGVVKTELALAERVYRCDACGLVLDRDLNAATNLSKLAKLA
jgi:IS605 OrfB family transposase